MKTDNDALAALIERAEYQVNETGCYSLNCNDLPILKAALTADNAKRGDLDDALYAVKVLKKFIRGEDHDKARPFIETIRQTLTTTAAISAPMTVDYADALTEFKKAEIDAETVYDYHCMMWLSFATIETIKKALSHDKAGLE